MEIPIVGAGAPVPPTVGDFIPCLSASSAGQVRRSCVAERQIVHCRFGVMTVPSSANRGFPQFLRSCPCSLQFVQRRRSFAAAVLGVSFASPLATDSLLSRLFLEEGGANFSGLIIESLGVPPVINPAPVAAPAPAPAADDDDESCTPHAALVSKSILPLRLPPPPPNFKGDAPAATSTRLAATESGL